MLNDSWEREFLNLASVWLACRLAVMGGTPVSPLHVPVTNFGTLGWAMLGEYDYRREMTLMVQEVRDVARGLH